MTGAVTDQSVIGEFEDLLRDREHSVVGDGGKQEKGEDSYRWSFYEKITVDASTIRDLRYAAMSAMSSTVAADQSDIEISDQSETETETETETAKEE